MTARWKIAIGLWVFFTAAFIVYRGVIPGWNDTKTDFNNYYASAKLFQQGEPIHAFYANEEFRELAIENGVENGAKFSPFPPPTAVLYWPLSFFELLTAKRIWLVVNVLLLVFLPFRIRHYFKETSLLENLFLISLFYVPLASNLHFGQFYFVAAFLLFEAIGGFLSRKKRYLPSILIGGLAAVKYLPILFLGYALNRSRDALKPILITLLTIVVITGIFLLIDAEAYTVYLRDLGGHVNGDLSGQGKYAIGFQSIDALLNNLFVYDSVENQRPFVNLAILKPLFKWTFIGVIGAFCWRMLQRENYSFSQVTVSICILGAFTIVPASASYHFLLLIAPVFFIDQWLRAEGMKRERLIVLILIVGTFFIQVHHVPHIYRWPLIDLLIHFPRFWLLLTLFSYLLYKRITRTNG
ncbi:MAG: glycosyltransferase family 87 protein [Crocinitomicaceae bacterium]